MIAHNKTDISLRNQFAELVNEILTFAGFIIAMFAGLYFASWWIFVAALLLSFILVRLGDKLLRNQKDEPNSG